MKEYSIVFTTYNDSKEIVGFLNNIILQSLAPKEIIMADGGSKDDTVQLARAFAEKSSVKITIISGKRLNISEGYNEAIKQAKTEYIGITGVGNVYDPNHFKVLMERFDAEDVDITYAPIRGYDSTNFSKLYNQAMLNGDKGNILRIASNHSALIKAKVFDEVGFFYEHFVYAGEDAEFYTRALNKGIRSAVVNDAYVYWKTPETLKAYNRQVKVYTIASMQIENMLQLVKHYRESILMWMVLIFCLIGVFTGNVSVLIVLMLYLLYILLKMKRYSVKCKLLRIYAIFLPIFYILTNLKYLSKKYKVNLEMQPN